MTRRKASLVQRRGLQKKQKLLRITYPTSSSKNNLPSRDLATFP